MNRLTRVLVFLVMCLSVQVCLGKDRVTNSHCDFSDNFASHMDSSYGDNVRKHFIQSENVDQLYEIKVVLPTTNKSIGKRYPVLYAADGNGNFEMLYKYGAALQASGCVSPYILVSVGYPNVSSSMFVSLRARDLSYLPDPPRSQAIKMHKQFISKEVDIREMSLIENMDLHLGAENFQNFIRLELIPFIEKTYPVQFDDRAYYGYSAGARFGFYTLVTHPETFSRYILGSAALSFFGKDVMLEKTSSYFASGKTIKAKIFHSVGSEEQFQVGFENVDFGSDYFKMAKILHAINSPDFEYTSRIFLDKNHNTAAEPAFVYGIQSVYAE